MSYDTLFEIPNSWIWAKLDDIGIVAAGGTPSTKDLENFGGEIPWLTPADLSEFNGKFIEKGNRNLSEKGLNSSSAKLLPEGSVLFSSRAPIGYVAIASNPISTNQGFKNLILTNDIFNDYVFHYLKGNKGLAESFASGTTFLELSAKRFSQLPIPIPPLNEQVRIVIKIEELFTKLDAGIQELTLAKEKLKIYRQSVLKHAFEGKLTEEWREVHKDEIESASIILEKLKAKRKSKSKTKSKIPPINLSDLPPLPNEWNYAELDIVTNVISGNAFKSKDFIDDKEIPVIKISNVSYGKFVWKNQQYLPTNFLKEFSNFLVRPNSLLMALTRPITNNTLKVCFYPENAENGLLNQRVAMIDPTDYIEKEFLFLFMQSPIFKNQVSKSMSETLQPNLSPIVLKNLFVPLSSMKEQKEILDNIEQRITIIEEIEKTIDHNLIYSQKLRQSILKKAFKGKLAPQDPNDEPAEKLLERIKAEKEKKPKRKKSKSKQKVLV